jgi:hypothetical protein
MSVGGTVLANRNVSYVSPTRVCTRANYIDVSTTRKKAKQATGSLLAIRGLLFLIGLIRLSSIKTVLNMHLGFNYGFHLVCHGV